MIIGFLLSVIYTLVYTFASNLTSDGGLPSAITNAATQFGGYLYAVNLFLPVDVLVNVMALSVTLLLAVFSIKVFKFIMGMIRGVGTGV